MMKVMAFSIAAAAGFLCLIAALYVLARPVVRGALYFPAPPAVVAAALALGGAKQGERMADLGSGDGRIVIAFARAGAAATGYEINPLLVWRSRRTIRAIGLAAAATVQRKDFWKEDLSIFDIIVVFGNRRVAQGMAEKLKRDAKPGARIVAILSPLPGWQLERREVVGRHSIYLYNIRFREPVRVIK